MQCVSVCVNEFVFSHLVLIQHLLLQFLHQLALQIDLIILHKQDGIINFKSYYRELPLGYQNVLNYFKQ